MLGWGVLLVGRLTMYKGLVVETWGERVDTALQTKMFLRDTHDACLGHLFQKRLDGSSGQEDSFEGTGMKSGRQSVPASTASKLGDIGRAFTT